MSGLKDTLAGLARAKRQLLRAGAVNANGSPDAGKFSLDGLAAVGIAPQLSEIQDFGANPGNLKMLCYAPKNGLDKSRSRRALVVALHGCSQAAAIYDLLSGWSAFAEREGFVVVCPEQRPANNPNLCFNWFDPRHARRDAGEAASIRQMVAYALAQHDVDPQRVFVVGLSAGGAMANVMLAAYPDVFAGGAVIAGLPYGAASNVSEALQMMTKGRHQPGRVWGQHVREASGYDGESWPRLSIWHGEMDPIVHPLNSEASLAQWVNVHGISPDPHAIETLAGHRRRVWLGPDGGAKVEAWGISALAHAVPLGAADGEPLGQIGPFHAEVGLSSTARIASFWGIAAELPAPAESAFAAATAAAAGQVDQVAEVITAALRQAGLMGGQAGAGPDAKTAAQSASAQAAEMLRKMGLLKD